MRGLRLLLRRRRQRFCNFAQSRTQSSGICLRRRQRVRAAAAAANNVPASSCFDVRSHPVKNREVSYGNTAAATAAFKGKTGPFRCRRGGLLQRIVLLLLLLLLLLKRSIFLRLGPSADGHQTLRRTFSSRSRTTLLLLLLLLLLFMLLAMYGSSNCRGGSRF